MSARGDEGLFLRCLTSLDERMSVKLLLRVWGPRIEFFVRLLLVATFLDDSLRTATHFSEHIPQVGEQGYLKSLAATSPGLVSGIATVALGIGLLVQSLGSLCLLALFQSDGATKVLIGWAVAQPVMYAQLANLEFVAESLSLVGGLLILRAHLLSEQAKRDSRRVLLGGGGLRASDGAAGASELVIARTQLLGRLLLPAVYLYHAGHVMAKLADHSGHSRRDFWRAEFVVNAAVFVVLGLCCTLVATGLRSRTIALVLAFTNLILVCYRHPFLRFVWREGGEWKYDEVAVRDSVPHVAMPKDMSPDDLEPWHIVDLHRYYFFQGLSTTGALLLLAQLGPGEIALQEDEVLLGDVQRARDYRPVKLDSADCAA